MIVKAVIAACIIGVVLSAQAPFTPARYRSGTVPPLPVMAVAGGQVFLELGVGPDGRVARVTPLRATPPFTELVVDAVRDWRFAPAEEHQTEAGPTSEQSLRKPVASTVLVAAVFRPPALNAPTLGEPPKDLASASSGTSFPLGTTMPAIPPSAHGSGVVLVEARVDPRGSVTRATVIRSAPPFDEVARAAAERWTFRPARVHGTPVPTLVYIMFGFPVPVIRTNSGPSLPRAIATD